MRDPAFQSRMLRLPVVGRLARRRSERLFDLLAGFTYTQTLLAFVRLGGPEALAGGPHAPAALAERFGLSPDAARRLLDAAEALELVARSGEGYVLGQLGLPLLGRPELLTLLEHDTLLYDDLRDPDALLRDDRRTPTHLSRFWSYARASDPRALPSGEAEAYSAVMAATQPLVAEQVLAAYDFRRHRRLLDVGGGDGAFLRAVAPAAPSLELALFELPPVAARARAACAAAGLAARVTAYEGSFLDDALPSGADLVSLVRVCFDHDDAVVRGLFARVHAALAPGGTLLIAEPMAGLPGAERVGSVYFGLYLLAMRSGRPRRPSEFAKLLQDSGFRDLVIHRVANPLQTGLITARR
ncbi:MAG TPA: methyltransferase [Gemmatimonadales bacterium]|nr:methyltransferase [Gemmatimonadales bacterium]